MTLNKREYYATKKHIVAFMLFAFSFAFPGISGAQQGLIKQEHIDRFNELASGFACLCGCGSTVKTCPHLKCGFAVPLKKELTSMILEDVPKEKIVEYFVAKHGDQLLSAPPKRGWYLVGYFLPVTLIVLVGLLIMKIVSRWAAVARASYKAENNGSLENEEITAEDKEYEDRIKKEMKDFDS